MINYFYLFGAIFFEVAGTLLLPASQNFTKLLPTATLTVCYLVAFYFLTFAIKTIPISVVYATWSGLGIFTIALFGYIIYNQTLNWQTVLGLFFIIPIPAYIFGIGYLLFTIYGMKKRLGNIGHDAHFGGAMGGYFITIILNPSVVTENLLMTLLLLIPLIVLFILQKTGKI